MVLSLLSAAAGAAHAAVPSWAMLAYLVSGVLFILALRGLSSPATSRAGNRYGMLGMTIAVGTTLVTHEVASLPEIIGALAIGGGIGFVIARRIAMTDMPQLVAAFHSLVGLAAVLVGWAAYLNPELSALPRWWRRFCPPAARSSRWAVTLPTLRP
jgi:NAD(P) transhydrogenase subunit beta